MSIVLRSIPLGSENDKCMTTVDVYILAAELIADGHKVTTCEAIEEVINKNLPATLTSLMFRDLCWGKLRFIMDRVDADPWYFETQEEDYEAERAHRVIALLFAAEFCQDQIEEKARKQKEGLKCETFN